MLCGLRRIGVWADPLVASIDIGRSDRHGIAITAAVADAFSCDGVRQLMNSPRVPGFGIPSEAGGFAGALLRNPLVWLGLLSIPAVAWLVHYTPFGLRVRAVGEHPTAAETLGVPVRRVRYFAVALSGILAGLGGVYLALDQHQFTDSMTAGRGFIALAAIIFGRWEPVRAGLACLLFAAAETLQIQLQGMQGIPSQFVQMIRTCSPSCRRGFVARSTHRGVGKGMKHERAPSALAP